mgnify:CR=1 FL=1
MGERRQWRDGVVVVWVLVLVLVLGGVCVYVCACVRVCGVRWVVVVLRFIIDVQDPHQLEFPKCAF